MKDFYDIWLLSRHFDFDSKTLAEAIRLTLKQRGTTLPTKIEAFTEAFIDAKQVQWEAFWNKLQQDHVPFKFQELISRVEIFLALSFHAPRPQKEKWATDNTNRMRGTKP